MSAHEETGPATTAEIVDEAPHEVRILGLVDIHWSGKRPLRFPSTEGYDLVLVAGDMTNFLGPDHARQVLQPLRDSGLPVYAVCGNCDQPEIEAFLEAEGIALDRRAVVEQGLCLAGLSAGLPFGDLPYERTESEYETACEEMWQAVREADASDRLPVLVVSHQPAHGTACDIARGNHVGSQSIRSSVEQHQPDLVFSGHIHESIGEDRLGETHLVNPGPWFEGRWVDITVTPSADRGRRIRTTIQHRSGR